MQFKASKTEPPVGALITLEAVKKSVKDVSVKWDAKTAFDIGDNVTLTTNSSIARYLARSAPDMGLYGGDIQQKTEVPLSYNVRLFLGLAWLDYYQCKLVLQGCAKLFI